ncbi:MAG: hypothetical protein AB7S69_08905 [Salinivirgaceae bacterium]|jgi:hypothetical protein
MKNKLPLLLIALLFGVLPACEKPEGTGGTSSIVGRVWVRDYNADFSRVVSEYWGEEEDVYIIYGNDSIHSDDAETSYNGYYRFNYLQNGEYTIFVYSKDSTFQSPSARVTVKQTINITKQGKEYLAPIITILD